MSNCKYQCLKTLAICWSCGNFCDFFFQNQQYCQTWTARITDFLTPWRCYHMGKVEEWGTHTRQHEKWWLCLAWVVLVLSSKDFQLPELSIQALNLPPLVVFKENLPINPRKTLCNLDQSVISLWLSIHRLTSRLSAAQEQALLSTDGLWRQPASCFCVAFLGARHTAKAPGIYFFV